jgi:hypothetical protein
MLLMCENTKIRPAETIPGIGRGRIKENDGGGQIQLLYILRTLVNVTMYTQNNNNEKEKRRKRNVFFCRTIDMKTKKYDIFKIQIVRDNACGG